MNLSAITRGLFLSLLLSACGGSGGGGGDVVDGSGVAKSFRVHTEALTPLPKRTDILRETGVNILAKVADISGNGYPDVLFITGYGQENFGDIDYEPGKSTITYYENDGGRFLDKTIEVFGERDVPYVARRVYIEDINSDSKPDILLVTNNEDGRSDSEALLDANTAPLIIFFSSEDGSYEMHKIGYSIWSHDASIGDIDSDGKIEIVDAGFYQHSNTIRPHTVSKVVYEINEDGTWQEDTLSKIDYLNLFSSGRHELKDYNGDGCPDLLSEIENEGLFGTFGLYTNDCTGGLTETQRFSYGSIPFFVQGTTEGQPVDHRIQEIDGIWYGGVSIVWSTSFDIDNDGDLDVIYSISGYLIPDEGREAGFIVINNHTVEGFERVFLLTNNGGEFDLSSDPLQGLPLNFSGLVYSSNQDLNNDGYLDLVISTDDARSDLYDLQYVVFLNQKNGSFKNPILEDAAHYSGYRQLLPLDYNLDGVGDFLSIIKPDRISQTELILLEGLKVLEN